MCSKRLTALQFHWGAQWDFQNVKIGGHSNTLSAATHTVQDQGSSYQQVAPCHNAKPLVYLPASPAFFWFLGWYVNPQGIFQFKKKNPALHTSSWTYFPYKSEDQPDPGAHTLTNASIWDSVHRQVGWQKNPISKIKTKKIQWKKNYTYILTVKMWRKMNSTQWSAGLLKASRFHYILF